MDIDLRDRGISRLCFSADQTSAEEAKVASAVSVFLADHNTITALDGLNAVFVNLVELHLSHNHLGESSTPYYRVNQSLLRSTGGGDSCCEGVASWIQALPSTLEVLDVAHNHLHSFLECRCRCSGSNAEPSPGDAPSISGEAAGGGEVALRALRHRCPFALPLFFPADRFPRLRELRLAHNSLAVSLRESDEMQEAVEGRFSSSAAVSALLPASLSLVDLSHNAGVAAVNCFFLPGSAEGAPAAPASVACTLMLAATALEDLQGLASLSALCPGVRWSLQLHPCPLTRSALAAPPDVLLQLLRMVLPTLEGSSVVADAAVDEDGRGLTAGQLDALEQRLRNEASPEEQEALRRSYGSAAGWVAVLTYLCLLQQVVPSMETGDGGFSMQRCEHLLAASLRRLQETERHAVQQHQPPAARRLPMSAAPPLHPPSAPPTALPQPRALSSLASCVAPELRSRVVVEDERPGVSSTAAVEAERRGSEGGCGRPGRFQAALAALRPSRSHSATTADTRSSSARSLLDDPHSTSSSVREETTAGGGGSAALHAAGDVDLYTPAGLSAEHRAAYEALCREAAELQAAVLASNERCRDVESQADALQRQLTQDRSLVADQRREVTRLRDETARLEHSLEAQRRRLEKRQREVAYGVSAIASREAAARERAAMARIAAREKAVARQERLLRQRAARAGALAVQYNSNGPHGERRKLRSEVLREAAVRRRLAEQENKDPLAYTPAHFKSDARRSTPRSSPDQESAALAEERAYLSLYANSAVSGLQEVAEHYVAQLPVPQQLQLREASTQLHSSGSAERATSRSRSRATSPSARSPFSSDATPPAAGTANGSHASGRDLSTLSLSELLDAAAAIRQKQLSLQQLHQQWRQPLQPPPPLHADAGTEQRQSPPGTSAPQSAAVDGATGRSERQTSDGAEAKSGLNAGESSHSPETAATNRDVNVNSPFQSELSEEPRVGSAQELFDFILAQRSRSRSVGKEDAAVLPTRSPFSTHHGDKWDEEREAVENAGVATQSAGAVRPQINRALFL